MGPGPGARRDATEKRNPGQGETTLAAKQLVVSGAGRGAMELGRSAANFAPHYNKRVLMRSLTLVLIMVSKKGMFGEEIQRNGIEPKTECMGRAGTQIQMKFRREMHLVKKTVVVSFYFEGPPPGKTM